MIRSPCQVIVILRFNRIITVRFVYPTHENSDYNPTVYNPYTVAYHDYEYFKLFYKDYPQYEVKLFDYNDYLEFRRYYEDKMF